MPPDAKLQPMGQDAKLQLMRREATRYQHPADVTRCHQMRSSSGCDQMTPDAELQRMPPVARAEAQVLRMPLGSIGQGKDTSNWFIRRRICTALCLNFLSFLFFFFSVRRSWQPRSFSHLFIFRIFSMNEQFESSFASQIC
jgi:hypothetical protein